jgi:hypothetical protein
MSELKVLFPSNGMMAPGTVDNNKLGSAREAADLRRDGDVVAISGFGGIGVSEEILEALEARFLETGEPRGLTLKQRGLSAHLYESPAEAGAALRRSRA